jgi:acetyltransferase
MWRYSYNLRGLYETPSLAEEVEEGDSPRQEVARILENARRSGRTLLTEIESKQILGRYNIPAVDTRLALSEDQAVSLAQEIGFPAVLKVYSEAITHKSDIGGVKLNLIDEQAVRYAYREIESAVRDKMGASQFQGVTVQPMVCLEGYELILGSSVDPQFGPVILFGSGGQLVEVYRDRALALPPLNATLAQRLMEQTRIFGALKGTRGRAPTNVNALERVLIRFSRLVIEQPWIKEIDINPLLASPTEILALDARIIIHAEDSVTGGLPKPAIRPYPTQYVSQWKTKAGIPVLIRPIRPEDEPLMAKFHESLSMDSVYLRYFHMVSLDARVAHAGLIQQCFIDYDREMALVVARLTKLLAECEAEVAIAVADAYQEQGLGTELLGRLIEIGRDERLKRIVAEILPENEAMLSLARHFDFRVELGFRPNALTFALNLQQ